MKHFVLPKSLFKKAPQYTFTDDGHTFTGFLYKDTVLVIKCTLNGNVYLSTQVDYVVPVKYWSEIKTKWSDILDGVSYEYAKEHWNEYIEELEKAYSFIKGIAK